MVNTVRVKVDDGRDFKNNPLAHQTTKLRNFTKSKSRDFSAFRFSLHLMLEQALSNLIVCLMISQKNYMQKLHERASMLQWIIGRFVFLQN